MKSLRDLFRLGPGPSSSHTIGPFSAAKAFLRLYRDKDFDNIAVTFYGSLACTGKGHHTDKAIEEAFKGINVAFAYDIDTKQKHPLTMSFEAKKGDTCIGKATYYSLGGGALYSDDDPSVNEQEVYPFSNLKEIITYMEQEGIYDFATFCKRFEDEGIDLYIEGVAKQMMATIRHGLKKTGKIPANDNPKLQYYRCAGAIMKQAEELTGGEGRRSMFITAYAYAAAESSSSGELVITSPTCGSCGVVPSILYYAHKNQKTSMTRIKNALYAAGVIGNVVKQNASIAGSVGGCEAEIGTASAMAAAALCALNGLSPYQIEYAAEVAMEHFLGLSCDPVDGFVIIPCIERNGMAAVHAYASYLYASIIAPIRKNQVSFDDVVAAMKLTGDSLSEAYKETSRGGLAKILEKNC